MPTCSCARGRSSTASSLPRCWTPSGGPASSPRVATSSLVT
jgi:hypothetical protein